MFTIEAVAKGTWGSEETPKKKARPSESESSPSTDQSPSVKKKKSKPKKQLKSKDDATEEEEEGDEEANKPQDAEIKTEEAPLTPKAEFENEPDLEEEPPSGLEDMEPHCSPLQPTELEEKDTDTKPPQTTQEDKDLEVKPENCGSRKSERSCKGALYKTLVSEGMLTSLRANVDRGNVLTHSSQGLFLLVDFVILTGFETHFPLVSADHVEQIVAWNKYTSLGTYLSPTCYSAEMTTLKKSVSIVLSGAEVPQ